MRRCVALVVLMLATTVPAALAQHLPRDLESLPWARKLWQAAAPGSLVRTAGDGAPRFVVVEDSSVGKPTQLTAFHARTGAVAWRHTVAEPSECLVWVSAVEGTGATLVVLKRREGLSLWTGGPAKPRATCTNTIHGVPDDGSPPWTMEGEELDTLLPAIAWHDAFLVNLGDKGLLTPYRTIVALVDARTGKIRWKMEAYLYDPVGAIDGDEAVIQLASDPARGVRVKPDGTASAMDASDLARFEKFVLRMPGRAMVRLEHGTLDWRGRNGESLALPPPPPSRCFGVGNQVWLLQRDGVHRWQGESFAPLPLLPLGRDVTGPMLQWTSTTCETKPIVNGLTYWPVDLRDSRFRALVMDPAEARVVDIIQLDGRADAVRGDLLVSTGYRTVTVWDLAPPWRTVTRTAAVRSGDVERWLFARTDAAQPTELTADALARLVRLGPQGWGKTLQKRLPGARAADLAAWAPVVCPEDSPRSAFLKRWVVLADRASITDVDILLATEEACAQDPGRNSRLGRLLLRAVRLPGTREGLRARLSVLGAMDRPPQGREASALAADVIEVIGTGPAGTRELAGFAREAVRTLDDWPGAPAWRRKLDRRLLARGKATICPRAERGGECLQAPPADAWMDPTATWAVFGGDAIPATRRDLWAMRKLQGRWSEPVLVGRRLDVPGREPEWRDAWKVPGDPSESQRLLAGFPLAAEGEMLHLPARSTDVATTMTWADLTRDRDRDGWTDLLEVRLGTDPTRADSDADGSIDSRDAAPLCASRIASDDVGGAVLAGLVAFRTAPEPLWVKGPCVDVPTLGGPVLPWDGESRPVVTLPSADGAAQERRLDVELHAMRCFAFVERVTVWLRFVGDRWRTVNVGADSWPFAPHREPVCRDDLLPTDPEKEDATEWEDAP